MGFNKTISRRTMLKGAAATGAALAASSVFPHSTSARTENADAVTLEFWTNHDAATDVPLFNKVIANFEAVNPGIKIHLTNYPSSSPFDPSIIPTRGISGTLPDVWYNRTYETADRANHGWTIPLDSYVKRDNFSMNDFWPQEVAQEEWKGHLYSLPYDWSDFGIYYNKAMFDKKGIKYPPADGNWTWDDVFKLAGEFVEKSGLRQTTFGIDLTPLTYFWSTAGFVLAWGGQWYSADLHSFPINNDGAAELFQTVEDAIFKTNSAIKGSTFPAGTDSLATGQVAMDLDGSWATLQHRNDIGNRFDWDVAPMPKGPTGKLPLSEAGGAWSIATNSKHQDEAWTWLKFLTSTASAEILISEPVRSIPGRKSAAPLWVKTAKSSGLPPAHASVFANIMLNSFQVASVPYYNELSTLSGNYIGDIMTLNKPVRATLAAWQEAANAAIKKYTF